MLNASQRTREIFATIFYIFGFLWVYVTNITGVISCQNTDCRLAVWFNLAGLAFIVIGIVIYYVKTKSQN